MHNLPNAFDFNGCSYIKGIIMLWPTNKSCHQLIDQVANFMLIIAASDDPLMPNESSNPTAYGDTYKCLSIFPHLMLPQIPATMKFFIAFLLQ